MYPQKSAMDVIGDGNQEIEQPASVCGTHWTPSIRLRVPLGSRKSENAKGTNNNTRMFSRNGSCGCKNIIQESKTSNPLVN